MECESSDPTSDALSNKILSGMHEWRLQHPDATLSEASTAEKLMCKAFPHGSAQIGDLQ
jgi:hypothetical protein